MNWKALVWSTILLLLLILLFQLAVMGLRAENDLQVVIGLSLLALFIGIVTYIVKSTTKS